MVIKGCEVTHLQEVTGAASNSLAVLGFYLLWLGFKLEAALSRGVVTGEESHGMVKCRGYVIKHTKKFGGLDFFYYLCGVKGLGYG